MQRFFYNKEEIRTKIGLLDVVLMKKIMIVYPNAKINLGLNIVSKRPDGYHNLETVFLPVPALHDELEVTLTDDSAPYSFTQEGIVVDCPAEDNLIIRAYLKMREQYPMVGNVRFRFKKAIPFGAGLGGGSADAAFTVKAINQLFRLCLTGEEMEQIVAPLGADCAFFIQNRPRFAEGVGNVFSEIPDGLMEQLHDKWLLLVKPDCAVSTRVAYQGIHPHTQAIPLFEALGKPITTWQQTVINDFEDSVFPQFPEIARIKQQLLATKPLYAAMSGSGASLFAIYDKRPDTTVFDKQSLFFNCSKL